MYLHRYPSTASANKRSLCNNSTSASTPKITKVNNEDRTRRVGTEQTNVNSPRSRLVQLARIGINDAGLVDTDEAGEQRRDQVGVGAVNADCEHVRVCGAQTGCPCETVPCTR